MTKLFWLLTFLPVGTAAVAITGAAVTGVSLENNAGGQEATATIRILNTSQHAITALVVRYREHYSDGKTNSGQHFEDYGPRDNPPGGIASANGQTIHKIAPGESSEHVEHFGLATLCESCSPEIPQSVEAEVIVAIYDDQTAEVEDDAAFENIIQIRRGDAEAAREAAKVFHDAAADQSPRDRAKRDFDALISNSEAKPANISDPTCTGTGCDPRKSAYEGKLKSNADLAASAPADTKEERTFFQSYARKLKQDADLFTRYCDIRRLP